MKCNDPFFGMALYSFVGAFLGIVAGLALGLLIAFITGLIPSSDMGQAPPMEMIVFLGMGWGAVIGGIMGGIIGIRKGK